MWKSQSMRTLKLVQPFFTSFEFWGLSIFLEYFKIKIKNSNDFSYYHLKIMQFDWILSVLEATEINAYPRISTTIFYLIWILKFFRVFPLVM